MSSSDIRKIPLRGCLTHDEGGYSVAGSFGLVFMGWCSWSQGLILVQVSCVLVVWKLRMELAMNWGVICEEWGSEGGGKVCLDYELWYGGMSDSRREAGWLVGRVGHIIPTFLDVHFPLIGRVKIGCTPLIGMDAWWTSASFYCPIWCPRSLPPLRCTNLRSGHGL